MTIDTPKGNEKNETLSIKEQTDLNITAAKEFADKNASIFKESPEDFKKTKKNTR